MKTSIFAVIAASLVSTVSFADRTTVYGTGTSYGMCNGMNYQSCIWRLRNDAEYKAENDIRFSCSGRGGRVISHPSCGYIFCNPNNMPPDAMDQMVSCRADCSAYCETSR